MSTYALSTMSSFARGYDLTQLKVSPTKKSQKQQTNKIKLKTNPEEIPNNKTIIIDNIEFLSKKKLIKLKEFQNEISRNNRIEKTIN